MSNKSPPKPFFVGWGKVPKTLRLFLCSFAAFLVLGFAMVSYMTASAQVDSGSGAFMGQTRATGVLQLHPYPVLHVIDSPHFAKGTSVLLSGNGKRGAFDQAQAFDGQVVEARGFRLNRGDLKGMQLRNGQRGLRASDDQTQAIDIEVEKLGRWRLEGEICDGKCLGGAMRPGTGLAHRACANLCLLGDVAPVFVSAGPVDGDVFLLMSGADGKAVASTMFDYTALLVALEGEVERHGDMLILKVTDDSIQVAR